MFADELFVTTEDEDLGLDWSRAACRTDEGSLTALFFSEQLDDIARAKAICSGCELVAPCLAGALARREPWGVWGGQLFANGKVLAQKRKRGRPPKVRPPDLLVDPYLLLVAEAAEAQSA